MESIYLSAFLYPSTKRDMFFLGEDGVVIASYKRALKAKLSRVCPSAVHDSLCICG